MILKNKILIVLVAFCVGLNSSFGQVTHPNDSVAATNLKLNQSVTTDFLKQDYKFDAKQLIAPGVLLAAGVTGVYTLHGFRESIRDAFRDESGNGTKVDNYIQYLPAAAYLTVGFIPGINRRGDFRDRLMAGITAYAVMAVVNNVMKVSFRERRPDSGARNSFPSGHSATAFTGAELMRIEYGNLIGFAGYAVATAVGVMRIYNDRHWINDIFGGAAVGILSARIGYWLLPWERKLFGLDKKNKTDQNISSMTILPMVGEVNGLSFSMTF